MKVLKSWRTWTLVVFMALGIVLGAAAVAAHSASSVPCGGGPRVLCGPKKTIPSAPARVRPTYKAPAVAGRG